MRPYLISITPATTVADGLASANSSAGTTVTLDGTLTSGGTFTSSDGMGRQLVITDAGGHNQTTATYTIVGTDADGIAVTESIAGPGALGSVNPVHYFLTVTSVTIASPVAGSTVSIGTTGILGTQTLPLNYRSDNGPTYAADVTGTIDYTVNETLDQIHTLTNPAYDSSWFPLAALTAKTADVLTTGTIHTTACQLVVNSFTAGADIQWTTMQNEYI